MWEVTTFRWQGLRNMSLACLMRVIQSKRLFSFVKISQDQASWVTWPCSARGNGGQDRFIYCKADASGNVDVSGTLHFIVIWEVPFLPVSPHLPLPSTSPAPTPTSRLILLSDIIHVWSFPFILRCWLIYNLFLSPFESLKFLRKDLDPFPLRLTAAECWRVEGFGVLRASHSS